MSGAWALYISKIDQVVCENARVLEMKSIHSRLSANRLAGQSMIEYSLIVVLASIISIAVVLLLGNYIGDSFTDAVRSL